MSGAPIAWVDGRRQIHIVRSDGSRHAQTMPDVMWGTWAGAGPPAAHSWPTWSPSGQRLAAFRMTGSTTSSAVQVMDVGGIHATEVADLQGRLPIYLHWSPDDTQVAVLSQDEDHLVLSSCAADQPASERKLVTASPLFFTWASAVDLAVYIGEDGTQGGTMAMVPASGGPRRPLPGGAVNFCAPVVVGDDVVYVSRIGERSHVVAASVHGGERRSLEVLDGLVALVAIDDGRHVLRAVAPDGDATPYRDIAIVDVATGEVQHVTDQPCLAFLWSPAGDAVVTARVDTDRNAISWDRVGLDGERSRIIDALPTRDIGFYLRFFEQYGQSHPLIDPTGEHLLIAGGVVAEAAKGARPVVMAVPIAGGPPVELGEGVFAVYGPP